MTRPLCKSSNFAIDGRLTGRLLLRNISNHIARTARSHHHDDTHDEAECPSSSPAAVSSFVEQSSWRNFDISCSKGANDWPVLSRSSSQTTSSRTVSFSERVDVRFTTSLQEISPQELAALWYTAEEYNKITQACSRQVERLNRGELLKDKKFCSRGLECHTHIRSLAKSLNRSMAYTVVLEEQRRQVIEGFIHDDAIARVYHDVSSSCQIWAHTVALADQREAERIQDNDDEEQMS